MRTTVDIDDELLRAATLRASLDGSSLAAVVEQALREYLSAAGAAVAPGPRIPVFHGQGMQPGVDLTNNAGLEDLLNPES